MRYKKLGNTDLNISVMTVGTWAIGADGWGDVDLKDSIDAIHTALDNGINFIFDEEQKELKYALPYQPLQNPELFRQCMEQGDALQFSHTTEDQLRTLLQAGFQLEDIYEDTNGTGRLHEFGVPTFLAFLARKPW